MKNTYIIAIKDKETLEPVLIQARPYTDISYIGRLYYRAYIFTTRQEARDTYLDRYKTYEEKQKEK
jgi:hypothetical protein